MGGALVSESLDKRRHGQRKKLWAKQKHEHAQEHGHELAHKHQQRKPQPAATQAAEASQFQLNDRADQGHVRTATVAQKMARTPRVQFSYGVDHVPAVVQRRAVKDQTVEKTQRNAAGRG